MELREQGFGNDDSVGLPMGGDGAGGLKELRRQGEAMGDSADDAVDRGLSRNSQKFNEGTRQRSGE